MTSLYLLQTTNPAPHPVMHTVRFKCIGSNKEPKYQSALAAAADLMKDRMDVKVKIFPEPSNPFDVQTISIKCNLDGKWVLIGYIE